MPTHSLCLGPARLDARAQEVLLRTASQALLREVPGLAQVQRLRVARHIPTDSLNDRRAHAGVTPESDQIETVLQLCFATAQAAQAVTGHAAWLPFLEQVRSAAPILFSLGSDTNVPIVPTGTAAAGGFRRWMLLTRKARTQEQFRDAWFGRHADLVKQLPHVDGYLQHLVTARYDARGAEAAYEAMPVDGIAELCFADEAAMEASYASDARLPLRDDGRELLGRITTVLVRGEAWQ